MLNQDHQMQNARARSRFVFSLDSPHPSFSIFRTLILGCIGTSDSESRLILQHFSRSTKFSHFRTACNSKIAAFFSVISQNLKFRIVLQNVAKFLMLDFQKLKNCKTNVNVIFKFYTFKFIQLLVLVDCFVDLKKTLKNDT